MTSSFADIYFNLITTHKTSHQLIINNIAVWTKSVNLKLKLFLNQSTVNPGSHLCLIVMCKMVLTWQHYCIYSSI